MHQGTEWCHEQPACNTGVWAPSWQSRHSKGGKGGEYEDKIWCELLKGQLLNWQFCCVSAYASARLNAENGQRCLDAGTAFHFGKKSIQIFSLKNIFNTWRHDNRIIEIDVLDGDSTCSGKCSSSQFGLISLQNEGKKKTNQHCLKSWCVWTTELLIEVPFPYYASDRWSVYNGGLSSVLWLSAE